ncbi:2-C-methyl-D-erythritol 2,4-cyclodiphosphate synthase [candidate division KSB1 bacterium]|nr:2-C-methyl-D-erythritol 2,4-cyclodiphosphate synthase [candidate division KSB1 bacterium]MBL7092983.1 2-C-methyl-D-erythritol 2,4-cyclodiphosphate synthase [candidate division KSB1 bacterium]
MKIGFGYDVHRLTEKRKLILGGVNIPFEKGLLGHSDADVLAHAIGDALLGAAALGDLGVHFPPSEAKYKDISSLILLEKIHSMVRKENFKIVNVDATIVAEKPRLIHYIKEMRQNIADTLKLRLDHISVKATTTEGLGFTGTGEGIAVYAVCLIDEIL